jgi:hypothetical protein
MEKYTEFFVYYLTSNVSYKDLYFPLADLPDNKTFKISCILNLTATCYGLALKCLPKLMLKVTSLRWYWEEVEFSGGGA